MEAFEFRAYEVLGFWTMVLVRVVAGEDGHVTRELIYKGDHVPIDEDDATLRATLLLSQASADLGWSLADLAAVPDPL